LVAFAAVALALAGCGRKGPLDLPPNAAGPVVEQGDTDEERAAARGTVYDPSYGANELPKTPKGNKRSFMARSVGIQQTILHSRSPAEFRLSAP